MQTITACGKRLKSNGERKPGVTVALGEQQHVDSAGALSAVVTPWSPSAAATLVGSIHGRRFVVRFDHPDQSTMGDEGLERSSFFSGKRPSCKEPGTHSGTVQDDSGQTPPGLAMVVNAWPLLSEAARKEILQVVRREAIAKAAD